jgi:endogenous inhibitor of DNA gyrase (YacG/DUF329 family)
MSKETTITCKSCGKKVKTTGSGDFSTFVCEACQEKINLPAYKAEITELKNNESITESQKVRLQFLRTKVKAIEPEKK